MERMLTDEQWVRIAPLLPPPKPRGRRRADDRQTLEGILWMLKTGARWQDLPREYGSKTRCQLKQARALIRKRFPDAPPTYGIKYPSDFEALVKAKEE